VRDAAAVQGAFAELRPAVVIHTAYDMEDRATTYDGAVNVARAAADVGARLIHLSTDVVFDGEKGAPYVEEDEPNPVTAYGRHKADAEPAVRAAHPQALIVRTSLMYGGAEPGRHERSAADPDSAFFTDELRSPVHVGDLAAALLELAGVERAGILHMAGADALSRYDFARLLAPHPESVRGATIEGSGLARPRECVLSSALAATVVRTRLRGAREVLVPRRPRP
jgi:dTDP-4-dehydrorhamnose reductase